MNKVLLGTIVVLTGGAFVVVAALAATCGVIGALLHDPSGAYASSDQTMVP